MSITEIEGDGNSEEALPETFFNPSFEALAIRARAAGLQFRQVTWGRPPKYSYTSPEIDFPAGSGTRTVRLLDHDVDRFLKFDFEQFRFSARYMAIFDVRSGDIECALTWSRALSARSGRTPVWELPGVELSEDSPLATGKPFEDYETPGGWKLAVSQGDLSLEISPSSKLFDMLAGRFVMSSDISLKIKTGQGVEGPRTDDTLGGIGEEFMLDLELKYGLGTTLAREREKGFDLDRPGASTGPSFPSLVYQQDAAAFYWYGVSAQEFPLLQYLAFYQVLEYFFSSFTRSAALSRLRSQLRDPAFDRNDDRALGVLIDSTKTVHAGLRQESDQLHQTVNECVESEALVNFLRSDQSLIEHFLGAKQRIKGTKTLRLGPDDDIRDQVAERVYRVRNRIVHSKAGAEDYGLELLLPISDETRFLGPEVELVRWLAQRALIHGARQR